MKNNTSFLLVAATVFAGVILSFGRIADFNADAPQIASAVTQTPDAVPTTDTEATYRIE